MKIAILGATSQIAQDLILSFSINKDYDFSLFGRNIELLEKWINSENLSEKYQIQEYSEFVNHQKYDVIINFVGIGDPAKAQKMGSDIFKVTEQYDDMALEY
ncbi:NAD(P)-dependent oxidoreductase, partial [Candidatus Woesearchaeota archaeon]|nr:NAD(P)-dependent oxidoreductase [Candidatus Woesearchaeota archaeon]